MDSPWDSPWSEQPRLASRATVQGLLLVASAFASLVVVILTVLSVAFLVLGVGVLLVPVSVTALRWTANQSRRLASAAGVEIVRPYLPRPEPPEGVLDVVHRTYWLLRDPATWRDLGWAVGNTFLGFLAGLFPVTTLAYAVQCTVVTGAAWAFFGEAGERFLEIFMPFGGTAGLALSMTIGGVSLATWLFGSHWVVRGHALLTNALLSPTRRALLADRVQELSETRTEIIDVQAAELRRIERDLHDGAQARLVAIGMKLGAADRYLESDVDAVRTLLLEAREASVKALEELRNLVRGIHPPLLSERGLAAAIEALALESPLDVELAVDLPRRLYAPLESAAYFAVSELLTNAAKHSDARHVGIVARLTEEKLIISVSDDGCGGASVNGGTGLRGIARRCASFDGSLDVRSPVGGPTVAILELPCASSSPRTSTY
ncbi:MULTISPECIES: sensor domain-containing protein [Actinosynnema]|uniref:sensor histidine kinase n=1 Tax=Actinosynnema TaxID=40566 RepID=UPI0020A361A1|nr:sensor domain-containing protein [Actinosynnema pretiosum]MCP2092265.1 Signal transduction histidine kinase [Actinosynnema pretiosum]